MRQRIVFGILVVVLGILAFLIASSWVIDHEYKKAAAAIVGAFVFPVAPCAWHFWRERKRGESKSTLTGYDRFWLRFATVALLVIGPMIAVGKLDVARAVFRHGLWFIPASPASIASIGNGAPRDLSAHGKLLARVPATAELVVLFHDTKPEGTGVLAWGGGKLVVAADKSLDDGKETLQQKIDELNAERTKLPWFPIENVAAVTTTDDTIVIASESWRGAVEPPGIGPSGDIRRELARSPQSAAFAAAFAPAHPIAGIVRAAAWANASDDDLVIEARVETITAAAATALVAQAHSALEGKLAEVPVKCRDGLGKLVDKVQLEATGPIVTARVTLDPMQVFGLALCAAD